MARLSDLQLASLLEELACSMRMGAPLPESLRRLQNRRLGAVARAAARIAEGLERGESLSAALAAIRSPLREEVAATVEACRQSGDADLLACLARQLRQRTEYVRNVRIAWIYPLLLVAIGYGVGVAVMGPTILNHGGRDMVWPEPVVAVAQWFQSFWYWPPIVLATAGVILIVWRGMQHRLPAEVRNRLFCQSLADQISHHTAEGEAIRTAAKMSGDPRLQAIDKPTFDSPEVQSILATSGEQAEAGIRSGLRTQESILARVRYMARVYEQQMRRRSFLWSRFFPRLVMIVLGGGMLLAYVVFVLAPVYRQGLP